jgi:hypothetical protein
MGDLEAPLTPDEAAGGWTEESKGAILKFFQNLHTELKTGKEIP